MKIRSKKFRKYLSYILIILWTVLITLLFVMPRWQQAISHKIYKSNYDFTRYLRIRSTMGFDQEERKLILEKMYPKLKEQIEEIALKGSQYYPLQVKEYDLYMDSIRTNYREKVDTLILVFVDSTDGTFKVNYSDSLIGKRHKVIGGEYLDNTFIKIRELLTKQPNKVVPIEYNFNGIKVGYGWYNPAMNRINGAVLDFRRLFIVNEQVEYLKIVLFAGFALFNIFILLLFLLLRYWEILKYKEAVEATGVGVAIFNKNRELQWWNNNFEKWFQTPQTAKQKVMLRIGIKLEEITSNEKEALRSFEECIAFNVKREYESKLGDKNLLTVLSPYMSKPLWGLLNKKVRVVAVDNALALELKETQKQHECVIHQLREKNDELKQLNRSKASLLHVIGHDLKSPLYAAKIQIKNIFNQLNQSENIYSPAQLKTDLDLVFEGIEQSDSLAKNLSSWAKEEFNEFPFEPTSVNLREVLEESIQSLKTLLACFDIEVENDIKNGIQSYADRNMVNTIFRNLINNAVRAIRENPSQPHGKIKVQSVEENKRVVILFSDNGKGMDENKKHFLFRQTDTADGLGTYLCKQFIQKHGEEAEIYVLNSYFGKTTIRFSLPLTQNI